MTLASERRFLKASACIGLACLVLLIARWAYQAEIRNRPSEFNSPNAANFHPISVTLVNLKINGQDVTDKVPKEMLLEKELTLSGQIQVIEGGKYYSDGRINLEPPLRVTEAGSHTIVVEPIDTTISEPDVQWSGPSSGVLVEVGGHLYNGNQNLPIENLVIQTLRRQVRADGLEITFRGEVPTLPFVEGKTIFTLYLGEAAEPHPDPRKKGFGIHRKLKQLDVR